MKKLFYSIGIGILTLASALTACKSSRPIDTIECTTPDGRTVIVTAVTNNILRITNVPKGSNVADAKVVETPQSSFTGHIETVDGQQVLVSPTGLRAAINVQDGRVIISGPNGINILDDGLRTMDSLGRQTINLTPGDEDPVYHGGGERGYALNLAGDTLVMYNRQNYGYTDGDERIKQMNITMPILISPKGYALVYDDFAASQLITGDTLQYATEASEPVTYYYVSSPDGFKGLSAELSQLLGRQEMPPFWSLGYITSKYGYKTQSEVDSVVATLKAAGYPLDGIVLDLYWYGQEEDMGRLEWDPDQWPSHAQMLASLNDQHVNLIPISQPYVLRNGRGLQNFNDLAAKGMFGKDSIGGVKDVVIWVGEGGMLDVSNPDTRAWLRQRYKDLTDEGVAGWWGDLGEPEKHPEGMIHANGLSTRQYHNLYGNDWSSIIYELFKEEYPDRRLMTLMRGGTIGLQKYSVFPWSTDVSRSWGGLQPQVKIMLNSGLSGLGYMSHDVGGFAVDSLAPKGPELYVRWLQMGLFTPILRTHAQQYSEPYVYADHQDIILPLIKERYRWLPYNYTLAWQNASMGLPLVRPMGMYSPEPWIYSDITDEYLWGPDVLVAPVIRQGERSRQVTFPAGSKWVDMNDPTKVYDGGTTAVVDAPLGIIPHFARAGALIPMADYNMTNTTDYNPADYTIYYYYVPGCGDSEFTLYEDNRTTPGHPEDIDHALVTFKAVNTPEKLVLSANLSGSYEGMPAAKDRKVTFVVFNIGKTDGISISRGNMSMNPAPAPDALSLTSTGSAYPTITITK